MKKWICILLAVLIFSCACAEDSLVQMQQMQKIYAAEHGFDEEDAGRPQLVIHLHNYDSWKAGATWQPTSFYLDVEMPIRILGEKSMDLYEASMKYDRTDVGVWLKMDGETYGLVFSEDGVKGVETYDRLYAAGEDFDRLLDMAEEALGYRPGDMDFAGKKIVSAKFEWLAGESTVEGENYKYGAGSVEVTDAKKLENLQKQLQNADYMLGSVNCPSNAFMVLEMEDGSTAGIAVAVNSFATFFYHGLCFGFEEGDIIDLFNLKETVFYKAIIGG